ncbi:MAG TPA: DUF5916 domain-containing protein [Parafilimonas sp.]|nr:DUF5916 domain-containing protein [Parafilimonas sp.]
MHREVFINIAWKNAAQYCTDVADKGYFENPGSTLSQNNNNNFSVKVIYFIDYYKIKNSRNKHKA